MSKQVLIGRHIPNKPIEFAEYEQLKHTEMWEFKVKLIINRENHDKVWVCSSYYDGDDNLFGVSSGHWQIHYDHSDGLYHMIYVVFRGMDDTYASYMCSYTTLAEAMGHAADRSEMEW